MKTFKIRFDELTDSQLKEVYFAFKFCRKHFSYSEQNDIYNYLKEELKFCGEAFLNSLDEIHNDKESYNNVYTSIDFTRINLFAEMSERFSESL
jgi:predicted PolB exonuclease-like 3'-5' exonuclease